MFCPITVANDPATRRLPFIRIIAALALIALAVTLWWRGVEFRDVSRWVAEQGSWAPALFVVVSIGLMSTVVPKTVIALSAGALFGTWLGGALLLLIAVIAAFVNYILGRWWFSEVTLGSPKDSVAGDEEAEEEDESGQQRPWLEAIAQLAGEAGFGFHLLVRLSPLPTMVISYAMGAYRARLVPYLSAAAVAAVPQLLWIHAAATAVDSEATGSRLVPTIATFTLAIIVFALLPRLTYLRLKEIRAGAG
ncbi:TVP38/TMEM64 family protein [Stieleria varia]|uniref:TVP38/TMEM64 family membrane protein n=1 Tax=Stieleria varia TaxID=2528005 RepID=A0A5C6A5C7_9BACT|nr:VTT domain-containing protein [Stieleria varia]TWT94636.1 SNARE associated Golgi protein [Stieleria varia]